MCGVNAKEQAVLEECLAQIERLEKDRAKKCADLVYREMRFLTARGSGRLSEKEARAKEREICGFLAGFLGISGKERSLLFMMEEIRAEAEPVLCRLERLGQKLAQQNLAQGGCLWHASAKGGLLCLTAAGRRENMYRNAYEEAVFATSSERQKWLYAARAVAGGMEADEQKHICIYETNPFCGREQDGWLLKRPAYLYRISQEGFSPVIDYLLGEDGRVRLFYAGEWMSREKTAQIVDCEEVSRIDRRYFAGLDVCCRRNGEIERV